MRSLVAFPTILFCFGLVAYAQPLVPVGGISAGCPATWPHRYGDATSFSCGDDDGAFCSGHVRSVDEASVRTEILAMGLVILREADAAAIHRFVYDDAAGHRIMRFVRASPGRSVDVVCGAPAAAFDGLVPTFVDIARSAR